MKRPGENQRLRKTLDSDRKVSVLSDEKAQAPDMKKDLLLFSLFLRDIELHAEFRRPRISATSAANLISAVHEAFHGLSLPE